MAQNSSQKGEKKEGTGKHTGTLWLFGILGVVGVIAILLLLFMEPSKSPEKPGTPSGQGGIRTVASQRFPYEITYDSDKYQFQEVLMDSQQGIYLERIFLTDAELNCYISVCRIDSSVDLDETLEAFEKDKEDSYEFSFTKEQGNFGAGNYPATHIYYHDTNADTPIDVHYYYSEEKQLLVTAAWDGKHEAEVKEMLAGLKITK